MAESGQAPDPKSGSHGFESCCGRQPEEPPMKKDKAIDKVFSDTSIPVKTTVERLEEIRDHVVELLAALDNG